MTNHQDRTVNPSRILTGVIKHNIISTIIGIRKALLLAGGMFGPYGHSEKRY